MNKMKKAMIILGLGFGLSGMLSGTANAIPNGGSCSDLQQQCQQGNSNSCNLWHFMGCIVCETGSSNNDTCKNNNVP
ncbi:MAG: hypothetical protein MJK04_18090 [Psychrosphaera sp.]|nr:hypothetical protein [Psychrosphaera sp.]